MKYSGTKTTYKEIMQDAKQYLEEPPMIALPGGTWCPFCNTELCRNGRHLNRQLLVLLVAKMARQLDDAYTNGVPENETKI